MSALSCNCIACIIFKSPALKIELKNLSSPTFFIQDFSKSNIYFQGLTLNSVPSKSPKWSLEHILKVSG